MRIGRVENALDLGRDGPVHEGSSSLESTRESWMECRSAGCSIRQLELSSDHDPLYRFHQWQANLRILEITEIKAIPYAPLSHPFVERDRHDSAGVSGPDAVLDDSGLERK